MLQLHQILMPQCRRARHLRHMVVATKEALIDIGKKNLQSPRAVMVEDFPLAHEQAPVVSEARLLIREARDTVAPLALVTRDTVAKIATELLRADTAPVAMGV